MGQTEVSAVGIVIANDGDGLRGGDVVLWRRFSGEVFHGKLLFELFPSCRKGKSATHSKILCDDLVNDVSVDISQTPVDAVVLYGEAFVVDAEKMEQGGVNVIHLCGICAVLGFVAPFITFPKGGASFDASSCQPALEP